LNAVGEASCQIFNKTIGHVLAPVADGKSRHQFGVWVNRNPRPHIAIAEHAPLVGRNILLLGVAELPNLVALDPARIYAAHGAVVKFCALRTNSLQQSQNRPLRNSGHTTGGANGISFHESRYDGNLLGKREPIHVQHYA